MDIDEYINKLLPEINDPLTIEMEQYAQKHQVPIMEPAGIALLLQVLEIHQPKKILEVGTAIGYSAIRMAKRLTDSTIVTLERDLERIQLAKQHIEKAGLENRIVILEGDALELESAVSDFGPFDIVFIDAAKGQYERFFDMYEPMVCKGGLIISDNVLFKGIVSGEKPAPHKRLEGMANKLRGYNERLMRDTRFSSMIYPVGDGVMVSIKKSASA
ncbi:O-methyltransferase [Evansella tamaricis]|uniref:tRNA 5-hydroxyuridine methyltransferase n=1 Tax=Evansella tamaricis TaxID=2069301 RepID=A0ABS6JFV6_9BACI|nr:O-methyltransferase [Evansella tamaricis]MBU9712544.1 O-methyltransferase [Evansella tamaricis]